MNLRKGFAPVIEESEVFTQGVDQDDADSGDESNGEEEMSATSRRVDPEHHAVSRRALVSALLNRSDRMWRSQSASPLVNKEDTDEENHEKKADCTSISISNMWIQPSTLALPCLALAIEQGPFGHAHAPFSGLDLLAATGNWSAVMRVLRMRSTLDNGETNSGDDSGGAATGIMAEESCAVLEELALHPPYLGSGANHSFPCYPFVHAAALAMRRDVTAFLEHYASLKATATTGDNPRISTPPLAIPAGGEERSGSNEEDKEEEDVEYMTESKTNVEISGSEEGESTLLAAPQPTPPAPPRMQSPPTPDVRSMSPEGQGQLSARASLNFLRLLLSSVRSFRKRRDDHDGSDGGPDTKNSKKRSRFTSAAVSSNTIDSTLSRLPSVRRSSSKGNGTGTRI